VFTVSFFVGAGDDWYSVGFFPGLAEPARVTLDYLEAAASRSYLVLSTELRLEFCDVAAFFLFYF
jgi:hypothetical protein